MLLVAPDCRQACLVSIFTSTDPIVAVLLRFPGFDDGVSFNPVCCFSLEISNKEPTAVLLVDCNPWWFIVSEFQPL